MLDLQDCFNIYIRVFSRDFCEGFLPVECGSWLSSDSPLDLKVVIICSTTRDLKVVIICSTTRDLKVVVMCSTTRSTHSQAWKTCSPLCITSAVASTRPTTPAPATARRRSSFSSSSSTTPSSSRPSPCTRRWWTSPPGRRSLARWVRTARSWRRNSSAPLR